jgi:hypothetical protein
MRSLLSLATVFTLVLLLRRVGGVVRGLGGVADTGGGGASGLDAISSPYGTHALGGHFALDTVLGVQISEAIMVVQGGANLGVYALSSPGERWGFGPFFVFARAVHANALLVLADQACRRSPRFP